MCWAHRKEGLGAGIVRIIREIGHSQDFVLKVVLRFF